MPPPTQWCTAPCPALSPASFWSPTQHCSAPASCCRPSPCCMHPLQPLSSGFAFPGQGRVPPQHNPITPHKKGWVGFFFPFNSPLILEGGEGGVRGGGWGEGG